MLPILLRLSILWLLLVPLSTQALTLSVLPVETYKQAVNLAAKTVTVADQYGTAVAIDHHYALTAAHVVLGSRHNNVYLRRPDGKKIAAEVVNIDTASDLALLKLNDKLQPLTFSKPTLGESVTAVGNDHNDGLHFTQGGIAFVGFTRTQNTAFPLVKSDARAQPGFSGGALLNKAQHVVGIITHIDNKTGYTHALEGKTAFAIAQTLKKK